MTKLLLDLSQDRGCASTVSFLIISMNKFSSLSELIPTPTKLPLQDYYETLLSTLICGSTVMNTKGYSALVQKRWDHTCMKYPKSVNLLSLQQTTATDILT